MYEDFATPEQKDNQYRLSMGHFIEYLEDNPHDLLWKRLQRRQRERETKIKALQNDWRAI